MLVPAFHFSSSTISDGTDALRPATLRGLGPDQTLVLVNGKRRHKSALLHVNTSVGRGTAGTDFNAIPSSAIERIEVLRDGAAAQYGSDAIAGVINIVLKDDVDTGAADIYWGQTYEGDGDTWNANANYGMKVGEAGFLNLTAEWRDRYRTNRAGLTGVRQYDWVEEDPGRPADQTLEIENDDGTVTEKPVWFDAREYTFERQNFRIGDADSTQKVGFYNFGLPLAAGLELYSFGGHSSRQNNSAGFYRDAIAMLRDTVPGVALTTDIIVGFCGEREDHFLNSLQLVRDLRFDQVHVAAFSPRRGTVAAEWPDDVPRAEKLRRLHRIEREQTGIAEDINQACLGHSHHVLFEELTPGKGGSDGPRWRGRTRTNKLVFVPDQPHLAAGQTRSVRITAATPWSLRGAVVADAAA